MILIDHAVYDERSIAANLGAPEYSYWFVRKAFRHVLERLGTVYGISDPDLEVDAIYQAARERGEPCAFLSFNPPQYVPLDLACPTVPVFAWEYDLIPDEVWSANPQDDWRVPLASCGAAITHSKYAARSVRRAMGDSYRVWSIPAPVYAANKDASPPIGWHRDFELLLEGGVAIDTTAVDLSIFREGKIEVVGVPALRALRRANAQRSNPVQAIKLNGVVYTAVFNPADGRKNWEDLVTGFVWAFRRNPDATLLIKVTQADMLEGLMPVLARLARLGPYTCRIIVIYGMLSDAAYASLVEATTYIVNASHGEGQCLPLMEFMSSGRPAIAPTHSAMAEYITPDNAFPLASSSRLVPWPHDRREVRRCHQRDIKFSSLVQAYLDSFRVVKETPHVYRYMSEAAAVALEYYCSDEVVSTRLKDVLENVTGRPAVAASSMSGSDLHVTAEIAGFRDAWMAGWFQPDGELYHGFTVGPNDKLFSVGPVSPEIMSFCETIGPSSFEHRPSDTGAVSLPNASVTRILCMDAINRCRDPEFLLAELARVGRPGSRYLFALPSAFHQELLEAADPNWTPDPRILSPDQLRQLIESAGLTIVHEDQDGFFQLLREAFALQPPSGDHLPIADAWAQTWCRILAASEDGRIQREFDQVLPARHLFIAEKPAGESLEAVPPRPCRAWQPQWAVPDGSGLEPTDPFMQGVRDSALGGWYNRGTGELAPGFPVSAEDVLLDMGCGGGGLTGFCAERGARIVLADMDPATVQDTGMSIEPLTDKPIETVVTDGDPLLLPDEMMTRIVCTEVLEHVDDPRRILAELVRVGQPGALYLLSVPAATVEHIVKEVGPEDYFRRPNHVRIFEEAAFHELVEEAGLTIEHRSADGFFWSLGLVLIFTKGVRPGGRNPTLDLWGATWKLVLDGPNGMAIKQTLDRFLPKRRVVVARKGAQQSALQTSTVRTSS